MQPCTHSTQAYTVLSQLDETAKSKSSLLSRFSFTLNWEKVILISNVALLTAGIAYGFFMRLPMIMGGLALYGIFYLALYKKVKNARPSSGKIQHLQDQITVLETKNRELAKTVKENLKGESLAKNLRDQAEEDLKKIKRLEGEHKKWIRKINAAKAEYKTELDKRVR